MKPSTGIDFRCHTCNVILKSLLTFYFQFQWEKYPQAIHVCISSSLSCAVSVSGETTLSTTHDRPFRAEGERERDKEGYTQLTQHTHTHTHTHSKDSHSAASLIIQTTTLYIPGKMLQYIPSHSARQLVKKGGQNAKIKAPSNHIKGSGMWKGGGEPSYSAMTITLHDS